MDLLRLESSPGCTYTLGMKKKALSALVLGLLWLAACNTTTPVLQPTLSAVESVEIERTTAPVISFGSTLVPTTIPTSLPRPSPSHTALPATKRAAQTAHSLNIAPWHGRLAFAAQRADTNRSGNFDLFTVSADGSTLRQLTYTPEDETTPSWLPDGTKIAYVRVTTHESGEQERDLYLLTLEGDVNQALPVGPGNIFAPHWSPDGRYLLFERIDEVEQVGKLYRVTNIYFWDMVTSLLIKLDLEGSSFGAIHC